MAEDADGILEEMEAQLGRIRAAMRQGGPAARTQLAALLMLAERLEVQMVDQERQPPRECPTCGQNWWRHREQPARWECTVCGRVVPNLKG
jgi:ribosomal protein L37AE/L43A